MVIAPQEYPAYILAGGRSSRFGSDKALVQLADGQVLLCQLQHTLSTLGHAVAVVAEREDRYQQLGISCLVDHAVDCGPLAAVATALQHRQETVGAGWCLVLSCDQWLWRPEWGATLAEHVSDELDAVGFARSPAAASPQKIEPLPCLLHTRALAHVLHLLETQQLALQTVFQRTRSRAVGCTLGPKRWSFNTPAELKVLLAQPE